MTVKRIIASIALMFLMLPAIQAQSIAADSIDGSSGRRSEKKVSRRTSVKNKEAVSEYDDLQRKIWKRRAKYFNLSYGVQKVKNDFKSAESEMAFALMLGKTFYLHKKPIAGMLKFGLDWTYIDLNFAKYKDLPSSDNTSIPVDSDIEPVDWGIMQAEAGMGFGPSVTINPVNHLKLSVYFHVTPSYSAMIQNSEMYHHYATFFNTGLTVSYKIISLGVESRWCGETSYDGVSLSRLDNLYDDEGNFQDPFKSVGTKFKTNAFRIFIGLRF